MKNIFYLLVIFATFSCQKDKVNLGDFVDEKFMVENKGSAMEIAIVGNTINSAILIYLPDGPGLAGIQYKTVAMRRFEEKYAVAYVDQRNSGTAQGRSKTKNTLALMTEDLDVLVDVLKKRYGKNKSVFVLGHGFGGMVASTFVTTDTLQNKIKGWINVGGITDFPNVANHSRNLFQKIGKEQIALNQNKSGWEPIVKWCDEHQGSLTLADKNYLNKLNVETLLKTEIDNQKDNSFSSNLANLVVNENISKTTYLLNYYLTSKHSSDINTDISNQTFDVRFGNLKVPTLFVVGKYDFICPPTLLDLSLKQVKSKYKKIIIAPKSGHDVHLNQPDLLIDELINFIDLFR
jgi:proline iminopeptidase